MKVLFIGGEFGTPALKTLDLRGVQTLGNESAVAGSCPKLSTIDIRKCTEIQGGNLAGCEKLYRITVCGNLDLPGMDADYDKLLAAFKSVYESAKNRKGVPYYY